MTKNDKDKLNWLIWFFIAVLSVALFFHFCIPEAKGQTPPMNPVTYDWQVDPLGIYLNTLDTYRVLQQHETLNRSVFSACDTTGGQTIGDVDSGYINFDKELIEASIYHHAVDDYAVAINQAGTYLVMARVTLHSPNSTDHSCYVQMNIKRYSASWLNVQGGMAGAYVGRLVSPSGQPFATQTVTCDEGDSIAIQIYNKSPDAGYDVQTVAEGVSLIIQRLY